MNDAREELMKLRFQQATGELTDYTRLRYTRRDIARLDDHPAVSAKGRLQMEGEA